MWPFKRQPVLEDDVARWHVDNMVWLLRNLAYTPMFRETRLVLPAPGYFDTDGAAGHARAEAIFAKVKAYAGMADWPVQLVSDVGTYEYQRGDLIQAAARPTPLGLFMRDHDEVVRIAYAPALLNKPVNLIATLAHELAHYVVTSIEDTLPCLPEEEEFLTDQTACFLGFGVFLANSAFEFDQWRNDGTGTQGWSTQRNGYLGEIDLIFDLALFLTAKGEPADAALPCLKPHLADLLKKAMKDAEAYRGELSAAMGNAYSYSDACRAD
ncbi:hypothetical protein ABAC402_14310 [Asticcacaulis sp. AC402]|nr:hypothetical protein ABAC402_14310 [Asticcacaulis sp. AC402]